MSNQMVQNIGALSIISLEKKNYSAKAPAEMPVSLEIM